MFSVTLYRIMHPTNCCGAEKKSFKYLNIQDLMKFNKTIIAYVPVGYENAHSQLGALCLVDDLPSYIQWALKEYL